MVHHFVNGGGGAYLSFGTALAWPATPADAGVGVLPDDGAQVTAKIDADDAVVEAAGLVVDATVRRLAVLGRVAVGGLRLQRRAVLPELRRGPRRAATRGGCASGRSASTAACAGRDIEAAGGVRPADVPSGAFVEWIVEAAPGAPRAEAGRDRPASSERAPPRPASRGAPRQRQPSGTAPARLRAEAQLC